ncbi:MAG: hypothetical protein GF329_14745 [Candidatus Lokiarchaeota archaeon]|nr:hypothetical protein [Candidatus Lokiarchaeota archaeon]
MEIEGIIPAFITIFDEQGEIDYALMKKHLDFLADNGVEKIFILGSSGEYAYLNINEKIKMIEEMGRYIKENHKYIQFWVGISSTNTKNSIKLGSIAKKNHADFIVAALPTYFPLEKDQIIQYYTEVADNTDLPLVAYNFEMATKVDLTPEILVELTDSGSIVGVKETGVPFNVIKELLELVPDNFSTIIGTDMMFKGALSLGIKAGILGSANFIPNYYVQFFKAFQENDTEKQDELWKLISKKIRILTYGISSIPSIIKEALIALGRPISSYVRAPLPTISDKIKEKIKKKLKNK